MVIPPPWKELAPTLPWTPAAVYHWFPANSIFSLKEVYFFIEFCHSLVWFWEVLYVPVWFCLVLYGFVWMELFGTLGSFKVLYSLEWYCLVMESLIWSFMVCVILCGFVWLSILHYANVFPWKVADGLDWLCMVFYSLTRPVEVFS